MDSIEGDQRQPHKLEGAPEVNADVLAKLGVLSYVHCFVAGDDLPYVQCHSWSGLSGEDDPTLSKIRKDRGYNYFDVISVAPDKLPNYETKIKSFYEGIETVSN